MRKSLESTTIEVALGLIPKKVAGVLFFSLFLGSIKGSIQATYPIIQVVCPDLLPFVRSDSI